MFPYKKRGLGGGQYFNFFLFSTNPLMHIILYQTLFYSQGNTHGAEGSLYAGASSGEVFTFKPVHDHGLFETNGFEQIEIIV